VADQIPTADVPTRLAQLSYPATGGTQKGTAGGPAPDQTQIILSSRMNNPSGADIALYTVPTGKTFLLTDFVVTGSPASGNPLVVLKYNTATTSGAIAVGTSAVTIANVNLLANLGADIFVGQAIDIEPPTAANYELVTVTAVSLNAAGIITGFTAAFTKTHAAGIVVGVPLELSLINATKGIEEIGIETQPTAPSGSVLTLNIGAFTGVLAYNVRGIIQ
jgi:hypothetical protein